MIFDNGYQVASVHFQHIYFFNDMIWVLKCWIGRLLQFTSDNQGALSVMTSILLFVAYILQYRTSDKQREIMEDQSETSGEQKNIMESQVDLYEQQTDLMRSQTDLMEAQKKLMNAGYTPIVGVKDREFQNNGDRLEMELVNRGNSIARDLKIELVIDYEESILSDGEGYKTMIAPLERSGAQWWKTDEGAVLGESEGIDVRTLFTADLKVKSLDPEEDDEYLTSALENLHSYGVEEVNVGIVLHFSNAQYDKSKINVYAAECQLGRLEAEGMDISEAMEVLADYVDEIRE